MNEHAMTMEQQGDHWVVRVIQGAEQRSFVCATEKMARQFLATLGRFSCRPVSRPAARAA